MEDPNFAELLKNGPLHAQSLYAKSAANCEYYWNDCLVTDYDKSNKNFKIVWLNQNKMQTKWVHRMNLMFDFDEGDKMDQRRVLAYERRDLNLYV